MVDSYVAKAGELVQGIVDELAEVAEGFVVAHFLVAGEVECVEEGVEVDFWWVGEGAEGEGVDAEGFFAGLVGDGEEGWRGCGAGE